MFLTKKKFSHALDSPIMEKHKQVRDTFEWASQNGHIKKLSGMDINHLKNIIAKIDRGDLESRKHYLFDLKNELIYREILNND